MAILRIPDKNITIRDFQKVREFLAERGVTHEQWHVPERPKDTATQEEILDAYKEHLVPFMERGNYKSADVINLHPGTPNVKEIRKKFLAEHTHDEDEIRFFIDGKGLFWFNLEGEVFSLECTAGDLISVPHGYTHWFDAGPEPFVKCIRIFTNPEGWVAKYTGSGIDRKYNPPDDELP